MAAPGGIKSRNKHHTEGTSLGNAPVSGPSNTKFGAEPNFPVASEVDPSEPSWKTEPARCMAKNIDISNGDMEVSLPSFAEHFLNVGGS